MRWHKTLSASAINKQVSRCVLTTKIFRTDSLANFLSYGAPLELAFARTKRHTWQHLRQTFDLNLRHNWRHLWHIFDLSLRRTHLMTLLASLWLESQTLSYRTFVKSLAQISDMTTPLTGRHKCLSNSYTFWRPLKVRLKGVTKMAFIAWRPAWNRRQRPIFVARQRCTKMCKGGVCRAFDAW